MAGGEDGKRGENLLGRKMKDGSIRWVNVGGTKEINLNAGDRIAIYTPGGGGYGTKVIPAYDMTSPSINGVVPKAIGVTTLKRLIPESRANGSLSTYSQQVASSF